MILEAVDYLPEIHILGILTGYDTQQDCFQAWIHQHEEPQTGKIA